VLKHFSFRLFLFVPLLLAFPFSLLSQTFTISGTVTDSTGINPLFGATVVLKTPRDSSAKIITGGQTDSLGKFTLTGVAPGFYRVTAIYSGYKPASKRVMVKDSNVVAGTIAMHYNGILLTGVDIRDKEVRVVVNGDTVAYNAGAYKTNPDATAEDLVNKLPGVTNDGGTLKVHGEEVKQVLVDGKPYFGDDPNAALKNMPADMVDKVQVYDKSSDQAQFTGFDDGQSKKTINIVTKKNAMNGQFGKIYAGYGTDDRYNAGATLNLFDNARRITFLGMSNNINQQNFSMQDIMGLNGSSGGGSGMRPMGMGGPRGGGSGGYSRGGSSNSFYVPQQNGISQTTAAGVNYSDDWGKKIKVTGSYFFNLSDNNNSTTLTRNYFTTADSTLSYNETSDAATRNINHRFNFRMEYTIDSMNTLIFNSRFTSQFTDYSKTLDGENISLTGIQQTSVHTTNLSKNLGYNITNGLTYRHRLGKPGRTFSIDLNETYSPRTGNGSYYSLNKYSDDTTLVNQVSTNKSASYTLSTTLAYSEPVKKKGQFLFTYSPSYTKSSADKRTNDYDFNANDFILPDTALSNKYDNIYFTQKAGINYRYNSQKASLIIGNDFQYAMLTGDQAFPAESHIDKTFQNVLPNATFNYKFNQGTNLKIIYRASTVAPTVSQLQNVVDNTNPLQLKTGNPDLSQDYEHMFIAHFGKTNIEKATGFFAFLYAGITSDYIGNSTFIAYRDTTVNGIFLNAGSQLTRYENMSGYKNMRGFFNYTFALTKIKCNLGVNLSGGISETPSLINDVRNISDNMNFGPGINLSSNISEKVDFNISYNGSFSQVTNSVQAQADNSYFTHTASMKLNWIVYKGLVFNTSLDQTYYSGLGQGYNTNYLLWNGSLGYKFLKNKSLETKFSVFDILDQNKSVSRSVTDTYIEDSRSNTLQRYFMLTVTYNIKKFKTPEPANKEAVPPAQPK
jgi:hypothetical protein